MRKAIVGLPVSTIALTRSSCCAKRSRLSRSPMWFSAQASREAWAENHMGDRDSLDLFAQQDDLVKAIVETGKPTIAFLINGRPPPVNYAAEHVPPAFQGCRLGRETGGPSP